MRSSTSNSSDNSPPVASPPEPAKLTQGFVAGAVFVVLFLIFAGYKYLAISAAIAANSNFSPPPEAVTTTISKSEQWPQTYEGIGTARAPQGAILSVEEPGTVSKIHVESGAEVQAGQLLVELDTSVEEAQLDGAKARLALARYELERLKPLRDRKAISKSDFDQAEAELRSADAQTKSLAALITRKRVVAPFSGTVGIRQVNLGEYVAAGRGIIPLFSSRPIFVDFTVPQVLLGTIKVGQPVEVSLSESTTTTTGTLTAIDPQVNERTRNIALQVTVQNEEGRLRPGMFVRVSLERGAPIEVIALPASSVSYAPYGDTVWVVETMKDPSGKEYLGVRPQVVTIGPSKGDLVAVLSGLTPGQQVATSGVFKLRPGAAVMVNNDFAPSGELMPQASDI